MKTLARRGFTLLEVVISMAILIVVCLIVFLLLFSSSSEGATQQTKVAMDGKVLEALNTIAEDIRNSGGVYSTVTTAGADTPLQAKDYWYDKNIPNRRYLLTMGQYSGFQPGTKTGAGITGSPVYADTVSYYWQPAFGEIPDNGIDDNHDGLIDEGDIIQVRTVGGVATTHTICRNVSPRGLAFEMLYGVNPPLTTNPPQSVKVMLQVMGLDTKGKVMYAQSQITAAPRTH
jgi:prepilin-type N-terminal cleavage/methylation domain-containing protein